MKEIMKYYVRLFMFLFPILFLPTTMDPFGFGKNWLILILAMIGMVLWTADLLINRREGFKINKLWGTGLLLIVWAWIGWWREQIGVRTRSFTDVGGIGTLMAMGLWFFLWLQVTDKEEERKQLNWLTVSGILVALSSIVVFLIPAAKLPIILPKNNPMLSIGSAWSLTGSLLNEVVLILFLVVEWSRRLFRKLKAERVEMYLTEAVVTAGLMLVLFLDIYRIIKVGWVNLDGSSAWVIAAETFKRMPIWGIGIGNFWEAFNSYRPVSYNLTSAWVSSFKFSSMGVLQLWTELGTVGLALVAIMGVKFIKQKKDFDFLRLLGVVIAALFLPVNLVTLMLLVWLAAGSLFETRVAPLSLKVGEKGLNIMPWISGTLVVAVMVFGGFWMYRVLLADVFMRQSMVAASKNDGGGTYNLQIKAIGMLSTMADYRGTYSQTNMALAKTILTGSNVADADKQKASVLIQQAVREGKAAIALDPNNPNYWSNLASIYQSLIGVVDGSAGWSFQAYQQAAYLDPSNVITKLSMGGLLYAAGNYDQADRVFEQVVGEKQDYANGWYNWAYSAKMSNDLPDAVQRLTQALALVPVDSGDYDKASKELAAWQKELDATNKQAAAQVKPAETLQTPQPLPTASKTNKVVVPTGELQPPTAAPQPTTQPTVNPTP
jgi:Tfp pilus assembly protein PilF